MNVLPFDLNLPTFDAHTTTESLKDFIESLNRGKASYLSCVNNYIIEIQTEITRREVIQLLDSDNQNDPDKLLLSK